ncbi:hypothetical protein KEM48_005965 [Puccinia striiformis f. sp. tritici PST-130]|nr:hypothetical protein KEM48_005965 [Puccinia striiformis f. sp. tritici PST-130]
MRLLTILGTLFASICLLEGLSAAPIAKEPLHVKTRDDQVKPGPSHPGPQARGKTIANPSRQMRPQHAPNIHRLSNLNPPGLLVPTPGSSTRKPLKFTSLGGTVLMYSSEFR